MQEKIASLMLKEHGRLNSFLVDFNRLLEKDLLLAEKALDKFKWNLEKHFFLEEKVIFDISSSIANEEVSEIFDLMKQHGEIMAELKDIEKNLQNRIKPKSEKLFSLIKEHADYEDSVFYPKLDEKLTENQKNYVVERVKEIIVA